MMSFHCNTGGQAFKHYHNLAAKADGPQTVHIDVFSAQTGVSRFGQIYGDSRITYDKTEGSLSDFGRFDHLIMENNVTKIKELDADFRVVREVQSFAGIAVDLHKFPPVTVKTKPSVAILEKRAKNKS